ncbi:glycosyltransferase [Planctomicrobium sp. SH527]|uniref:glycosyltransferase n=1 Tax=Planctomicrobium sp. SH527 TaxID=3448123 RepID=UPI003F5C2718
MRLLFISTTFPDSASPTRGTYNSALVRALSRQHEVSVISPRFFTEVYSRRGKKSFAVPEEMVSRGIPVQYPTYWYTPRVWQSAYGDQMWWSVKKVVQKTLKTFQPDAVLSYWAHPDGDVARRAAAIANVPSAVIVGGSDVLILPHLPGRGVRVREVLNASDAVITVSNGLRKKTVELGVPESKVHTIYQGVDEHLFDHQLTRRDARKRLNLDDKLAHLLWVGRVVEIKALPVLFDAVALLKERGLRFQLHLLGSGPLKAPLQQLAQSRQLDDVIRFHGAVGHDQIGNWYRAADLTVLTSDSEGLPNVLRESLACGTPFVSTDIGSVREIAFPEATCFVPPRNPGAFADAVQSMLAEEAKLAAAAYQPSTWEDSAQETVSLFRSLLRTDRKQPLADTVGPRLVNAGRDQR